MVNHGCHPIDEEFVIDLEVGNLDEQKDFAKLSDFVKLSVNDGCNDNVVKVVIDSKVEGDKVGKEKRKKGSSVKKAPKPPRPPRGFSLDAADQKLIKELAELAMMKRARIERMKALKQKRALQAASNSSTSGSLFATIFTVIFFLMIFLQGMSCKSSSVTSQVSPQTAQTNENGLVFTQEQLNPSASNSILPHSKSSSLFEKISGSRSARKKLQ
nr:PAB-dependent poly(A)-specific ribonuclease [Tanacetum cinerariifolium]